MDCDESNTFYNGCNGRTPVLSWQYLNVTRIGLMTEQAYPYHASVNKIDYD